MSSSVAREKGDSPFDDDDDNDDDDEDGGGGGDDKHEHGAQTFFEI